MSEILGKCQGESGPQAVVEKMLGWQYNFYVYPEKPWNEKFLKKISPLAIILLCILVVKQVFLFKVILCLFCLLDCLGSFATAHGYSFDIQI